jgi:membrane protein
MFFRSAFSVLKEAAVRWNRHHGPRLGASLSYYTAFSIAPLLVLTISIAGLIFGHDAAQGKIVAELSTLMGSQSASVIESLLRATQKPSSGVTATLIGLVVLLIGASGVMSELKDALNIIWGIRGRDGIKIFLKDRLLSIGMVLVIGFLLLVSLIVSAGLAALGSYFQQALPVPSWILQTVNFAVSFGVIALLFAMIFKMLPDAEVMWRDVWIGAALTSFFFSIGKSLLGVYLGKGVFGSAYGAAGSVLMMLLWVYYSAQVLYFGAEITKIVADRYGAGIKPAPAAATDS